MWRVQCEYLGMGKVGGTHGVRSIEIMLYDGAVLHVVDQTWLPRTDDEVTQLAGRAEMEHEGGYQRAHP